MKNKEYKKSIQNFGLHFNHHLKNVQFKKVQYFCHGIEF